MFTSYRIVKLAAVLSVLGLGVAGISGVAQAADQIAGTPHDLRTTDNGGPEKWDNTDPLNPVLIGRRLSGSDTNTDMCIYCHTPHMRASADAVAPLWNRTIVSSAFTMYDSTASASIDMDVAAEPQGVSLACLSCHDGVTGLDSGVQESGRQGSGTIDGTATPAVMGGRHAIGFDGDLTDQHPISVTYDTSLDTSFQSQVSAEADGIVFYGSTGDQVECGSCHNPHDAVTVTNRFLRMSNDGSQLCLACHIK